MVVPMFGRFVTLPSSRNVVVGMIQPDDDPPTIMTVVHATMIIPLNTIVPLTTTALPQTIDRSSLDNDRSSLQQHHQGSSQPNGSAHHEPSLFHPNRSTHLELERPIRTANAVSTVQRHLENNRRAAHRDSFGLLKSLPEEIQRVLKALPPSPQFCWSDKGKLFA